MQLIRIFGIGSNTNNHSRFVIAKISLILLIGLASAASAQEASQYSAHTDNTPAIRASLYAADNNSTSPVEGQPQEILAKARQMLKGQNKDTEGAKKLLLYLVKEKRSLLDTNSLCYVYVYLGYIQDLSGNRKSALTWFKLACKLKGPNIKGIQQLAEIGTQKPVIWIRHLDDGDKKPAKQNTANKGIIDRIGSGLVLKNQPQDAEPPKNRLTREERLENFDILAEAIDKHFSFFVHKNIDWPTVVNRYRPKIKKAKTTKEFYYLLYRFVRELNDAHSWLCNYRDVPRLGSYSPQISTRLIENKILVTTVAENSPAYKRGLRPGAAIVSIDGLSIKAKIKKIRPLLSMYSSERAFLEQACRQILNGKPDSTTTIKFIPASSRRTKTARLKRTTRTREEIIQPNIPLKKGKYVWYGQLPSGHGYIHIRSFMGRMEIADEFDSAIEALKNTPGLIIDVRENKGGYGTAQRRIIGRLITEPTKVCTGYRKNGPEHSDFSERDTYFGPIGSWQYTKPAILLINSVTGSASDLFTCYMASTGRVTTIGSDTHGNLTGAGVYVQLPCNLIVRVSNGYICDTSGKVIENNGNKAQIPAKLTVADIVNGTDPVIKRAVAELQSQQ